MVRVVFDTNIWLSALFWKGEASKLIELAERKKFEVIVSKEILLEISDVLNKEAKFQKFLKEKEQRIKEVIRSILFIGNLIPIKNKLNIIYQHPADNIFLELAIDGKARYIISYDNHLLNLKEFREIKILKPSQFFKVLKSGL